MGRTLVALTADLWTDLGAGPMVVELHRAPIPPSAAAGSSLLVDNNDGGEDTVAIRVNYNELGSQIRSDDGANVWAKGEGAGWEVIVDI